MEVARSLCGEWHWHKSQTVIGGDETNNAGKHDYSCEGLHEKAAASLISFCSCLIEAEDCKRYRKKAVEGGGWWGLLNVKYSKTNLSATYVVCLARERWGHNNNITIASNS